MGSSPSHNISADNSSFKCDVCQRQNKSSIAVSYCKDCEEKLCQNCDNVHRNSKASQNHTLVTREQLKQMKSKSQTQDTENTKADVVSGQVNDTTNSDPSSVINHAGKVRPKSTKADGNSRRTQGTNTDSNNVIGGVKVAKHNPNSVPGRVKYTHTTAGAVSGRVVDKKINLRSLVPGRVKDTQTTAGAVSGRVKDTNNTKGSVPGRKLDSSTVPSVVDLTVSDIKYHNVGCKQVQSVVFMPSGHVVLACARDGLKLLDRHFKQLSRLSLLCAIYACKVSGTEVLVSRGREKLIQFVQVLPTMVAKNVLTIGKLPAGICYHNGEIYVACVDDNPGYGEVRVLNRQGTLIRILGYHGGAYMSAMPWDVKINNAGDKVFVTDRVSHSVTCMDQTGGTLYQYTDKDLTWPAGMLVDRQDNILVTAWESDNVHVINNNGNKHKLVLTRKDGLYGPMCISCRQNDGLLAIGMYSKDGTNSLITMNTSLS